MRTAWRICRRIYRVVARALHRRTRQKSRNSLQWSSLIFVHSTHWPTYDSVQAYDVCVLNPSGRALRNVFGFKRVDVRNIKKNKPFRMYTPIYYYSSTGMGGGGVCAQCDCFNSTKTKLIYDEQYFHYLHIVRQIYLYSVPYYTWFLFRFWESWNWTVFIFIFCYLYNYIYYRDCEFNALNTL